MQFPSSIIGFVRTPYTSIRRAAKVLLFATCWVACDPGAPHSVSNRGQTPGSVTGTALTTSDLQTLRWVKGTWRGTGGGRPVPEVPSLTCPHRAGATTLCQALMERASRALMRSGVPSALVMQEVASGNVVAYASFSPNGPPGATPSFSPATSIFPLSAIKLFSAAIWWEHFGDLGRTFRCPKAREPDERVDEILIWGCDAAGVELAVELRKRLGSATVLADLERMGFNRSVPEDATSARSVLRGGEGGVNAPLRDAAPGTSTFELLPENARVMLTAETSDSAWGGSLSIGEMNFSTSLLHLSSFLQAVGNDGIRLLPSMMTGTPSADQRRPRAGRVDRSGARIMSPSTARRLQLAMHEVVRVGSAKGVLPRLAGTRWDLGGKTGTGPGQASPHTGGLFAALVFDAEKRPRYSVVVLTLGAGIGGGVAAGIAAEMTEALELLNSARVGKNHRPPT